MDTILIFQNKNYKLNKDTIIIIFIIVKILTISNCLPIANVISVLTQLIYHINTNVWIVKKQYAKNAFELIL